MCDMYTMSKSNIFDVNGIFNNHIICKTRTKKWSNCLGAHETQTVCHESLACDIWGSDGVAGYELRRRRYHQMGEKGEYCRI